MTLYESECFKAIELAAFVRRTQALTDYNNSADAVSNWAISYVVSQSSIGKAAKAITFLCHLCEVLLLLKYLFFSFHLYFSFSIL